MKLYIYIYIYTNRSYHRQSSTPGPWEGGVARKISALELSELSAGALRIWVPEERIAV